MTDLVHLVPPRPEKRDEVTNTSSRHRPPIGTGSGTWNVVEKTDGPRPAFGTRCAACGERMILLDGLPTHPSCDLPRRHPRGFYSRLAHKRWPRAEWIAGDDRYASVAYCRVTTVQTYQWITQAENAKRIIDSSGCGGRCVRRHKIIDLEPL